jgi:hypothetical protein
MDVFIDLPITADSCKDAIVSAPCESIDLVAWVFGLTDKEYQACSKDHSHLMANGCRQRLGSLSAETGSLSTV